MQSCCAEERPAPNPFIPGTPTSPATPTDLLSSTSFASSRSLPFAVPAFAPTSESRRGRSSNLNPFLGFPYCFRVSRVQLCCGASGNPGFVTPMAHSATALCCPSLRHSGGCTHTPPSAPIRRFARPPPAAAAAAATGATPGSALGARRARAAGNGHARMASRESVFYDEDAVADAQAAPLSKADR